MSERFAHLKHLEKKKPTAAGSPAGEVVRPPVAVREKGGILDKKETAVRTLLAEYGRIKKQALAARNGSKIDDGLAALSLAEEFLDRADRLNKAPANALNEDELDGILEQYGQPEQTSAKESLTPDLLTAATPEGREIQINLKEQLKYWADFYKEENIDWVKLPDEINLTPDQIEKMRALMAEGFDKLLIIPSGLVDEPTITKNSKGAPKSISNPKYAKLHSLMSQGYNDTKTWGNYDEDGKFEGSKDKTTKFRLILTKDVQNLADDPLFKGTRNKSTEELEKDELTRYSGFAESTYLIYQREYFKRTGKHLDEEGWTWLTESDRPLSGRAAHVRWDPDDGRLYFDSSTRGNHFGFLGCRLAGSFEIQI